MSKLIILEAARGGGGSGQLVLDKSVWQAIVCIARRGGHALSHDLLIPDVDRKLFASAIVTGLKQHATSKSQNRFKLEADGPACDPNKVDAVLSLLERGYGGIVITEREKV